MAMVYLNIYDFMESDDVQYTTQFLFKLTIAAT